MRYCRFIFTTCNGKVTETSLQLSDGFQVDDNSVILQLWKDCGPVKFVVNSDGSITIPVEEIQKVIAQNG